MTRLTLYSSRGCHLCSDMKEIIARVIAFRSDIELEEIDISSDPELEARFRREIPVLLVDGRKAAKFRLEESALRRMLGPSACE